LNHHIIDNQLVVDIRQDRWVPFKKAEAGTVMRGVDSMTIIEILSKEIKAETIYSNKIYVLWKMRSM